MFDARRAPLHGLLLSSQRDASSTSSAATETTSTITPQAVKSKLAAHAGGGVGHRGRGGVGGARRVAGA
eukprot:1625476-Rhodomonas_salina.1